MRNKAKPTTTAALHKNPKASAVKLDRKKPKIIMSKELRRISQISDPMQTLDECRSRIKEVKKGHQLRIRTYLAATAESAQRVCNDKNAWLKLMNNKFWEKCSGERPTAHDRADGLRFAVRYAENALSRPAAQNASKHTAVIQFLLSQGVAPAKMSSRPDCGAADPMLADQFNHANPLTADSLIYFE
jgi:hypothetical protein